MTKFEIKETQIDNLNDTYNQLTKFQGGLNIVCGENEIGKSTLIEFIKNILMRKTDAKGYIKCAYNNEEYILRAEKNKAKDNENYISIINPYNYKTGFVINLDDIMLAQKSDAEKLVNTLKDSSGNSVNKIADDYYNYIHDKKQRFQLTPTNSESVNFKRQFDKLKELSSQIKDIQAKENEYIELSQNIENLNQELNNLSEIYKYTELSEQKKQISENINNINLNLKLLENKSAFEKLREEYGGVNLSKQKEADLNKNIEENKKTFDEKLKGVNVIENFDINSLEDFNISSENINLSKNLIENKKDFEKNKEQLNLNISEINERINRLKFEIQSAENELEMIGINDLDEYKKDYDIFQSYENRYTSLIDNAYNSDPVGEAWYKNMQLYLFMIMFAFGSGFLFQYRATNLSIAFIIITLIALAGTIFTIIEPLLVKKNRNFKNELDKNAKEMINLCRKYKFELNQKENFIVKIGAHIQTMKDKISEYKRIQDNLFKIRIDLEREKENLKNKENSLSELTDKISENREKISEFLDKTFIKNIENYPEIYEEIKEMKALQDKIKSDEGELKNINNNTEKFIENLNKFIELTELNHIQKLNKYDYNDSEKILTKIRELLDENISNQKILAELNTKLMSCDELLNNSPYTDETDSKTIKQTIIQKRDERSRLIQARETLEQVENLVTLKNEKYAELNKLKDGLSKLIQKELIYNIISSAKEKFNETQPNLISAKNFLAKITSEKYTQIDFENKTISGQNTPEKSWDKLSRGTKEQLYLALRLGYAYNYSDKNNIKLPLIIDDAFVNFDQERTTAVLKCLNNFAEENQVLYFTCHAKMIKSILESEKIPHNLIEL